MQGLLRSHRPVGGCGRPELVGAGRPKSVPGGGKGLGFFFLSTFFRLLVRAFPTCWMQEA